MDLTKSRLSEPDSATPNEQLLLNQLNFVQRALEEQYRARREQERHASACAERVELQAMELANVKADLQAVLNSRTWRMTAPFRRLLDRHR
jgi:hypothetical protein